MLFFLSLHKKSKPKIIKTRNFERQLPTDKKGHPISDIYDTGYDSEELPVFETKQQCLRDDSTYVNNIPIVANDINVPPIHRRADST